MTRPKNDRRVNFLPLVTYFKPQGIPVSYLEVITLSVDELEALRIADGEEIEQKIAAQKMDISQSTFQRILAVARKKVALALIEGKAIKIEGGKFKVAKKLERRFKCEICKNIWSLPFGTGKRGIEMTCPTCGSEQIHRIDRQGHGDGRQIWGYRKQK
jgi:uncharacterized protein